ncbi:acyl-CoA thioesterase [bacterium]|nr:acyl-CoA thioesterase [bacterium]NCT21065.1 acyl-CoA thioesterase [bacterium]
MTEFNFYHPIEVRYADIDAQGHMNNAKYLTFFEQARIHYLLHLGLFRREQSFDDIGIILADVHLTFLAPVTWQTPVTVGVKTSRIGNKSMTVLNSLFNAESGEEMARAEIVLVTYDYHTGKTVPVPAEWREKIGAFDGCR